MSPAVHDSLAGAATYLSARQKPDGRWEDFDLPVGRSDAWVTAYAGRSLLRAGRATADPRAVECAERAARWLGSARAYERGWGYNAATGPDADSTAHAILLLRDAGLAVDPADERWLLGHWVPDAGFA